jgi:23S rRNA (adenine2503-C2)-methyltransferase
MTSVSKEMRAELKRFTVDRPEVWPADFQRRHPQMAAAAAERRQCRETARGRVRSIPRPTAARCASLAGRLHAELLVCHTGTQRLVRNLTAGEIAGQVMVARDRLNDGPIARMAAASSPTS